MHVMLSLFVFLTTTNAAAQDNAVAYEETVSVSLQAAQMDTLYAIRALKSATTAAEETAAIGEEAGGKLEQALRSTRDAAILTDKASVAFEETVSVGYTFTEDALRSTEDAITNVKAANAACTAPVSARFAIAADEALNALTDAVEELQIALSKR